MRSVAVFLLTSLFLIACNNYSQPFDSSTSSQNAATELLANSISFDHADPNSIRQIVFNFNQNIAILGAVPSQQQINSISMSHNLAQHCTWRFVDLKRLACELKQPLRVYTHYKIQLTPAFQALGRLINMTHSPQTQAFISTSFLPNINYWLQNNDEHFPKSIVANLHSTNNNTTQSIFNILTQVELLAPNGVRHKVKLTYTNENIENSAIRILLPKLNANFVDGQYHLIIPKDFAAQIVSKEDSWQYRTLENDDILYSFEYRSRPEFIGFMCSEGNKNTLINTDYLNANTNEQTVLYAMPCPPTKLGFAFSRPVQNLIAKAPPMHSPTLRTTSSHMLVQSRQTESTQLDWLTGPEYELKNRIHEHNVHIYYTQLQGFAQYSLNLEQVIYESNLASQQKRKIQFLTQEPTPHWQFSSAFGSVVEADTHVMPHFSRANVPDMQAQMQPLNTPDALLRYLNGDPDNQLSKQQISLPPTEQSLHKQSLQAINVKQALGNQSGLVAVELSGTRSLENAYLFSPRATPQSNIALNANKLGVQKEAFMANAAGFNIAVWHKQDLLVQAIDWQANAIENAAVLLVCESQTTPLKLGSTNAKGLLFIDRKQWQAQYANLQENACWLWLQSNTANTQHQSATIELPKAEIDSFENVSVSAYTVQPIYEPGDKVHIGFVGFEQIVDSTHTQANKDASSAIRPFQQIEDYTFSIVTPFDKHYANLTFAPISAMGLSNSTYILPKHMLPGYYTIAMQHKATGHKQFIGRINVAEFSPPEFEQSLQLDEIITVGSPISVQVLAKRMNGVALVGATSNLKLSLNRSHIKPAQWPQKFEYSSYTEFKTLRELDKSMPNKQSLYTREHFTESLNDSGRGVFISAPIKSNLAFAEIDIINEVVARDGMALETYKHAFYVGRDYIIGTHRNTDTNQLDLIAINANGEPVMGVQANLVFSQRKILSHSNKAEYITVRECELEALPASCPLNDLRGAFEIEITTNATKRNKPLRYKWYRNVYMPSISEEAKEETLEVSLKIDKKTYQVGESVPIHLNSTVAGTVTLILESGTIRKVWQQAVTVGNNSIELQASSAWLPSASLYVSLPLSRNEVSAFIERKKAKHINTTRYPHENWLQKYTDIWRKSRLLTDAISFSVSPNSPEPNIEIQVSAASHEDIYAGSEVSILVSTNLQQKPNIEGNNPVEAQLWLVNEALWSLTNTSKNMYDLDEDIYGDFAYHAFMQRNSLNQHLVYDANLDSPDNGIEKIAVTGSRLSAPFSDMKLGDGNMLNKPLNKALSLSPNSPLHTKLKQLNPDDFAQSKWLGTVRLNANKTETLQVKLPQLIGRWKVVAVSASSNQTAVSTTSFNTVRKREYFVDAPRNIYANDASRIAVTQINNTNKAQHDLLSFWVNGQLHSEFKTQFAPQEYKRIEIDLPKLSLGENTLVLTSEQETDFVAMHVVEVKNNITTQGLTWLQASNANAKDEIKIAMPPSAIPSTIELRYANSTSLQPNWQALIEFNKTYPHMCWEQTVSRAVALKNTPNAFALWPSGEQKINNLLAKQALHYNDGGFSYFPYQPQDAFLSAYTYLAHAWLQNTALAIKIDDKLVTRLRHYISGNANSQNNAQFSEDNHVLNKSMALLALAANKKITLNEALNLRQLIGSEASRNNLSALVLQGLALKYLGANPSQYENVLQTVNVYSANNTYQDTYSSLFNQNSDKCYLAMLHPNGSVAQTALIQEVLAEQAHNGHFGSTFADSVCTELLTSTEYQQNKTTEKGALKFAINNTQIIAPTAPHIPGTYLYKLAYKQSISSLPEIQNGLILSRKLWVKRGLNWEALPLNEQSTFGKSSNIKIGDLIKTELQVYSARPRQHVAIVDSITGGFEAVNPDTSNQLYRNANDYSRYQWHMQNNFSINKGQVLWQLKYLSKGDTSLVYYSRVRHSGAYLQAPATAEAMYRSDIKAATPANKIYIAQ